MGSWPRGDRKGLRVVTSQHMDEVVVSVGLCNRPYCFQSVGVHDPIVAYVIVLPGQMGPAKVAWVALRSVDATVASVGVGERWRRWRRWWREGGVGGEMLERWWLVR